MTRCAAGLLLAILCGGPAMAEGSYGFETDVSTRYVFRGLAYSRGGVNQSRVWGRTSGFTLYGWGNVVLSSQPLQERLDEVDVGVSYAHQAKGLLLEPGIDVYLYRGQPPFDVPSTGEVSLKLSHPMGRAGLFTRQVVDVHRYRGAYFGEAGASCERGLGRRARLAASVSIGWASAGFNAAYFKVRKPALDLVAAELSLSYAASDRLELRPHLTLTRIVDGELARAVATPNQASFGLAVAFRAGARGGR